MMSSLTASTVASYIKTLHTTRTDRIGAYWVEESRLRKEFADAVERELGELAVLATVVQKGDFDDPNGVIDDLAQTIERNRHWFTDGRRLAIVRDQKFSLVLVSRAPLGVPQLASPIELPPWFPAWPGVLLTTHIVSIAHSIDLSLSAPEIPASEICAALHSLELALCRRLLVTSQTHPNEVRELFSKAGKRKDDPKDVAGVAKTRTLESSANDFRPGGAAVSPHIVSMLFRLWWVTPPNQLHNLSVLVASALGFAKDDSVEVYSALGTLFTRTSNPPPATVPRGVMFAYSVLVGVSHAIQFSNATHHAGDYPNFPALLAVGYASDIARSCTKAAETINAHCEDVENRQS